MKEPWHALTVGLRQKNGQSLGVRPLTNMDRVKVSPVPALHSSLDVCSLFSLSLPLLLLSSPLPMAQTPKPDSQTQSPTAKPLSDPAAAAAAGLIVATTDPIRSFLLSAASDSGPRLSPELRELASDLSCQRSVPYKSLRSIWSALPIGSRPSLTRLFAGSEFVFSSPKPREKSEELKARLRKLEELAERKAYAELVKDITPKKETDEPFSSYKDQIGFGIHVVLIMFTGYLVGYAAFRALFNHSAVMNAAGGIIGLVGGMLVETLLFIVKTSSQDAVSSSATAKLKKHQ